MKVSKVVSITVLALALVGLSLYTLGCKTEEIKPINESNRVDSTAPLGTTNVKMDIWQAAQARGDLSQFVRAVEAAGLEDTLKSGGPYTVFAPTDAAWAKLSQEQINDLFKPENKDQLRSILQNHIVSGRMTISDLATHDTLNTKGTAELRVLSTADRITVSGANLTGGQVVAENGIIHPVDTVIMVK